MSNYKIVDLDTNETLGAYDSYDQAAADIVVIYARRDDMVDPPVVFPRAIDPTDCGCTECLTGEYVPLGQATTVQVQDMLLGKIGNNTYSQDIEIEVSVKVEGQVFTISGSTARRLLSFGL